MRPEELADLRNAATRDAQRLLDEVWGDQVPVDPWEIASKLGIRAESSPRLPPDVSGLIMRSESGDARILVDSRDSPRRQRFTCAHEIGHLIQNVDKERIDFVDRRTAPGVDKNPEEIYADEFAANLLMPENAVRASIGGSALGAMDILTLARKFDVSELAMSYRLRRLEILGG